MSHDKFNYDDPTGEVPASALRLDATVELGERSSDDTKTAPVRLRARTGHPIDHWYWGKIAHDVNGFELTGDKSKLSILYNHDEPVGYALAKNISTDGGDLSVDGTLVKTRKDTDRTTDVIDWMAGGIPFESSISFAGGPPELEKVKKDEFAEVNGERFEGPGVIVRKWKLREVSIVTSGADDGTESSLLSEGDTVPVTFTSAKDENMSDTNTQETLAAVEDQASVDTAAVNDSSEAVELSAAVEEQQADAEGTESRPAQKYFDAFGEQQGSWYFAHGIPFDEALAAELKRLKDENSELSQRVDAAATAGADDAVAFSNGEVKPPKEGYDQEGKLTAIPVNVPERQPTRKL